MGIFNNYLNSLVTQQSKILFARPQALNLLRLAVPKQANGPYTPKPAGIVADSLVRFTSPLSHQATSTSLPAAPVEVPAPKSNANSTISSLAAMSAAATKVGAFTSQLVTGAGAKLSAAFGSGYATLTKGILSLFVSKTNKATPSEDSGLATLPKLAQSAEAKSYVPSLPVELWGVIAEHCDLLQLASLAGVNKQLSQIVACELRQPERSRASTSVEAAFVRRQAAAAAKKAADENYAAVHERQREQATRQKDGSLRLAAAPLREAMVRQLYADMNSDKTTRRHRLELGLLTDSSEIFYASLNM